MIKTLVEIELFALFVNNKCDNHKLFNDIIGLCDNEIKKSQGHADSEHYDTLRKLMNLENNAGWDSEAKHKRRMEIIRTDENKIEERSEKYLP